VLVEVANVAAGHVGGTINPEGDTVRDLSAPSFGVETGVIESLLASIHMNPSSLVFRVHFCPDMVLCIPDPTNTSTDRAAEHAEAVGPLTSSATASLKELPDVGITGESLVGAASGFGTTVEFNAGGTTGGLVGGRGSHALGDGGHAALRAWGVVDEFEERSLEPSVKQGMSVNMGTVDSGLDGSVAHLSNALMTQSWYPHSGLPPTLAAWAWMI
jgi:hypothetical protein